MINNRQSLKELFHNIGPNSCPNIFNLHCHTTFSDGSLDAMQLYDQANLNGLKYLSITDHHSCKAFSIINNLINSNLFKNKFNTKLISGIEITCILKKCLVHILGFGFDVNHESMIPYQQGEAQKGDLLQAINVINSIHQAGGLAILAHPARYRINHKIIINEASQIGIDGGEAWYDYDYRLNWEPTPIVCESINKQLNHLGLISTCGTDTHGIDIKKR